MRLLFIYIILCSVHFFGLHFLLGSYANDLIDFTYFIILGVLLLANYLFSSKNYKYPKKHRLFIKPIIFLFIALFISAIFGYVFHDQPLYRTILGMRYFSYFLMFFIFLSFGIKKEHLIKIIITGAFLYIIVFTLQLFLYPKQIVPFGPELDFDRGFLRIRLEGVGFITLTAFYSLNRFLVTKKSKKYLLLYFICFFYVFILGFRTLLVTFVLASALLVILNNGIRLVKNLKVLIPLSIGIIFLFQLTVVQDFLFDAIERTESQLDMGDEYIRFFTYDFLFNTVNVNYWTLFFGNGFPVEGSDYGNLVLIKGAKENGLISADLGLIGFVFNYGILSLLFFLNIFRVAIVKKVSKDSIYLKVFFIYLIISSITTAEIFRAGMFGVQMIALYLVTIASFDLKLKEYNEKHNSV